MGLKKKIQGLQEAERVIRCTRNVNCREAWLLLPAVFHDSKDSG